MMPLTLTISFHALPKHTLRRTPSNSGLGIGVLCLTERLSDPTTT
jgi:hypothetical protein